MKSVLIIFGILALTAFFLSCSNTPTGSNTPEPKIVDVSIVDNQFQPPSKTINVNDTVKWTNNGVRVHTSTSGVNGVPDGKWDSGDLQPGISYSFKFTSTGTFNYYCTHHVTMGMTGTITVVQP